MIPHKMHGLVGASVLLMFSADPAWAQQKIEEAGTDFAVRDNQVSELEKGHIVVLVKTKGVTIMDDPSHPLNMTAPDCTGIFEEFPDGKFKGNGYCAAADQDGHKLFSAWSESSETDPENRYQIAGGTGKFEGAKGEGTYTITEVSPGPQGRHVVRWQGTAEYPNVQK
jgi:hypothetical protein